MDSTKYRFGSLIKEGIFRKYILRSKLKIATFIKDSALFLSL